MCDITLFQTYIIDKKKYSWGGKQYLSYTNYVGEKNKKMIFLR